MPNHRKCASAALVIAALAILGACGKDSPTAVSQDLTLFTFELTATGAVAQTMTGTASFGILREAGGPPTFVLTMLTPNQQYMTAVLAPGTRPGTERFDIGQAAGEFLGMFMIGLSSTSRTFMATDGYLELTTSTSGEMVGTLSLTATEVVGTATVAVTGRFRASCSPMAQLTCD